MRHWTQDAAHVAADVLMTAGLAAMLWRGGWEPVALCIAGVVLLIALRALEARDGWKQATEALTIAQGVRAELDAVKKDAEEARKQAVSARNEANARPNRVPVNQY